jgi:copper oxidase (laccase) domain-containing protein
MGPCIKKCCYEVSDEFKADFVNALGGCAGEYFTQKSGGKHMCDLPGINMMLLSDVIGEKNIEAAKNCTCCEKDLFFSHRRQGEQRGTHAAFIGIS